MGEAPGKDEVDQGRPFVGASGRELDKMLGEAGIARSDCSLSNVFSQRPPNNDEEYFCVEKKELPEGYSLPPLVTHPRARYVAPRYLDGLERLRQEIQEVKPQVILCLGKTALWALGNRTDLGSCRGFVQKCTLVPGYKILATHHPARILRDWSLRVISVADFVKCFREQDSKDIIYDKTQIWINPNLEDLYAFEKKYFQREVPIAADIETFGGLIRCIGFAPSASHSLVIPFFSPAKGAYWPTALFGKAVHFVKRVLQTYRIIYHNGGYDVSVLTRFGFAPTGYSDDTMLLHHALYPELKKSLEFLGSYLANRPSWKKMRPRGNKTGKREE